jgi:hypothetical protein
MEEIMVAEPLGKIRDQGSPKGDTIRFTPMRVESSRRVFNQKTGTMKTKETKTTFLQIRNIKTAIVQGSMTDAEMIETTAKPTRGMIIIEEATIG